MMKIPFHILLFAIRAALAATVTPNAASNYLFSTPLRPEPIRGLVMGSPPAYYVMRGEDFDWLNEALRERLAYMNGDLPDGTNTTLAAEFGKWDLAETNRFHRWTTAVDAAGVTNVVVGYHIVTNTPPTSGSPGPTIYDSSWLIGDAAAQLWNPAGGRSGYLDPDVPLATGARAYNYRQVWTNIYSVASYKEVLTNAFSTISLPMTNGTVSVHTNQWHGYIQVPCDIVYTNVTESGESPIHFCHAGSGAFPGYTNVQPIAYYGPNNLTRFAVPTVISNDYVALRGAVRLADDSRSPTNAPARSTAAEHYFGVSYRYEEETDEYVPEAWTSDSSNVYTNLSTVDWLDYSFNRSHYMWDAVEYTVHNREEGRVSGTAVFKTRFPSGLATIGGTLRIAVEAMYAAVGFSYQNHSLTNSDDRVEIDTNVVLRLAGPLLDVSGPIATVRAALDSRAICETAARAAGAPAPPSSLDGDPGEGRGESWWISPSGFVIFYRIYPTSKFADW